jgi:CTP synthase
MKVSREIGSFYTSVIKALNEIDPNWSNYEGYLLVGSHTPKELKLVEILSDLKKYRENNLPVLGLCMGMQLMCIEYMRNVWGIEVANSTEIEPDTKVPIIHKLPELRVGIKPVKDRMESHWHNYAFNTAYQELFEKDWDMVFTDNILEEMRLKNYPQYVGVQYHPEYQSSKDNPHLILKNFINYAKLAMPMVANFR